MASVFWDTNLFIYLFERNAEWSPRVVELRRKMLTRGDELLTSYLTIGEVIAKPKQLGTAMLEKSYLIFFRAALWSWSHSVWMPPNGTEIFVVVSEFVPLTPSNWLVLPQPAPICS